MRRPADLLRAPGSIGFVPRPRAGASAARPTATASPPPTPGPVADPHAAARAIEHLVRVAVVLVGDQDLAHRLVEGVLTTLPPARRSAALAAPGTPAVWRPLVAAAQTLDAQLASESMAPVVAAPLTTRPIGERRRPNQREVRWALLGQPMVERAALALAAAGVDPTVAAGALGLDEPALAAVGGAATRQLAGVLDIGPEEVGATVAGALAAVRVQVPADAAGALLAQPRTLLPGNRRRDALRIGAAALALLGALVWLSQREPARRSTLPVGAVPRLDTSRPLATTTTVTTVTTAARSATDAAATATATTVVPVVAGPALPPEPSTPAPGAAAPATASPGTSAAQATTTTARPATPSVAPATTTAATIPNVGPAGGPTTIATTPPPTAVTAAPAPVTTVRPATTAPAAPPTAAPTTAPRVTVAPTTAAPPTVPRTTVAPTTVVPALTKLAISSASCSRFLLSVSFTVTGVTDRSTPTVQLATPYGRYTATATATGNGSSAGWTVSAFAPLAFTSDATVRATSGAQSVSATMTC